jgi:hypothetical protein
MKRDLLAKLTPSDLRAEAEKLIRTGKMPSLADVVEAIRTVKKNQITLHLSFATR